MSSFLPSGSPSEPDAPPAAPRRLLSPQERFGRPASSPGASPEAAPSSGAHPGETRFAEESAPDPFVPEASSLRRDDEMARRHLPPRERRRERALRERERREAKLRAARHFEQHEQRAEAERDFTLAARENPDDAPPVAARRNRAPRGGGRRFFKRLLLMAGVAAAGYGVFAALTRPEFEVQSVHVAGARITPPEKLRPLAARLVGQNWLRADRQTVERAALRLPSVAAARVARLPVWPPRLELRLTERQPLLKVGAGENWWVADRSGVPFRRSNVGDAALYSVTSPAFEPQLGRALPAKAWARAVALNAALASDNKLATPNGAYWQLRRIYFDRDGLASLRLSFAAHKELLLRLGDEAWPQKLERARQSLSYFERTGRRARELDLVSLERPVWQPQPSSLRADSPSSTQATNAG